ncbi:sugar phosphate isomerase/epimerase [Hathewaya histolytica]|uniref:AP endonuclease n=1 Tax=Hathewaya histolytica TaxID=1498 RepID=A0A4U9R5S1_HATHI|nr:sugar phosphate isomerase/epimerase [Hathewaya histolytica]VTQ85901.1 AP endonuclease [Hathewaya histolytica]
MEIGLSSATFYPKINTEDSLKIIKDLGFDFAEIFINTHSEYSPKFLEILKKEKEKTELEILSVHAFCAIFELYLFDPYIRRRKDMIKYFKKHCKLTKELGAEFYTFHGMKYSSLDKNKLRSIKEIYEELSYIAGENGIKLAQENVSWCQSSSLEFLQFLKGEVKNPIYFTLDIKQAYKSGISPSEYIKIMGNRLVNIHINDRSSTEDCLLPGKGDVDFEKLFEELKKAGYKGKAIIEVYNENFNSYNELIESKKYLENI